MAEDLITLDNQKSILPPITIAVRVDAKKDPVQFTCRRLVREVMRKHYGWEAEMNAASEARDAGKVDELIYSHLAYMFEIDPKVLEKFEYEQVHLALNKLVFKIARRKIESTVEFLENQKPKKKEKPKQPARVTPRKRKSSNKTGGTGSKK